MEIPENWTKENDMLVREFTFNNYVEVVNFINKLVPIAEEMEHHPDFQVYGYKNIKITLTTHDKGNKVTELDIKMAKAINTLFIK